MQTNRTVIVLALGYLLFIAAVSLFYVVNKESEPEFSLAGPMKFNVAGTGHYVFVVTKDYMFTEWEDAVAFVKKNEKKKEQ